MSLIQEGTSEAMINMDNLQNAAVEFLVGERVLFLDGFSEDQGLTIIPVKFEEMGLYKEKGAVRRYISVEDAIAMLENPNLTNKEATTAFLREIGCELTQ